MLFNTPFSLRFSFSIKKQTVEHVFALSSVAFVHISIHALSYIVSLLTVIIIVESAFRVTICYVIVLYLRGREYINTFGIKMEKCLLWWHISAALDHQRLPTLILQYVHFVRRQTALPSCSTGIINSACVTGAFKTTLSTSRWEE